MSPFRLSRGVQAPLLVAALALLPSRAAHAQSAPEDPKAVVAACEDRGGWSDRDHHCEVRDAELSGSTRHLVVDGRRNGGIAVRAWDRNTVLVRARIESWAETSGRAAELARGIKVVTTGDNIHAEGPSTSDGESWAVSYELWVPRASNYDLDLQTYNGGVAVSDVGGRMRLETHNGGLALRNVQGDVRARTQNGGVNVGLTGARWEGTGLDVETTNGGVRAEIPHGYSARLELGTVNGRLNVDFPVTVQGSIGRRIETTLGSGGAPVRLVTTNGGVVVRER